MTTEGKKEPEGVALDDPWMSQTQAATALGCSRQKVLDYVARGQLDRTVAAGQVLIARESVERLRERLERDAQNDD